MLMLLLHLRERGRNGLSRWRPQSLSRAGPPPQCGHDLTLPSRRSRSSIFGCILLLPGFVVQQPPCNTLLWYLPCSRFEILFGILVDLQLCPFGTFRLGQVLTISSATYESRAASPRLAHSIWHHGVRSLLYCSFLTSALART
jgi:hypothetical protein